MRIRIIGKQVDTNNNIMDKIELTTDVNLHLEGDVLIFDYLENNNNDIIKTRLRATSKKLIMTKICSLSSTLEFEKDKKYTSIYSTVYGDLNMEILTESYDFIKTEDGFHKINLTYKIKLGESSPYVNILSIETFA